MAIRNDGSQFIYILKDTCGLPQCGSISTCFDDWYELQDYIEDDEELLERLEQGYAVIVEQDI